MGNGNYSDVERTCETMKSLTYETIIAELIEKLRSAYGITGELSGETDVMELGLDSLDMMNYVFFLEETYGITIEDAKIQKNGLLVIGETAKYILNTMSD